MAMFRVHLRIRTVRAKNIATNTSLSLSYLDSPFVGSGLVGESSASEPQKMPAFAYQQRETQHKTHHREQHNKEEELLEHLLRAYPSERNQRLIEMLKARQSHYQVFYPARDSDEREKEEEEVGSVKEDGKRMSVNVSETVDRSAKLVNTSRVAANTKPTSTITNKLRFQRAPTESSSKAPQSNSNSSPNFKVSFMTTNIHGVK